MHLSFAFTDLKISVWTINFFWDTYHLNRDMEHCFEVKLASALLKEILKTLAEKVHHHHVIHFAILSLLIADKVKKGDEGLTT